MRWWQRQGLGFKLALVITLTLFLVLGGSFFGIYKYTQAQLWQREVQIVENVNALAAVSLEDAMMIGQRDRVQQALEKLGQSVGGHIDSIAVYDDEGVLTSFASGFPDGRTVQRESLEKDTSDPTCWSCHQLAPEERPAMAIVSIEGQEILRSVVPLYNEPHCQTCHGTGQEILGESLVDLRLDRYRQASTAITIGLVVGVTLSIVLVALVLYVLLRRTVLSPLGELVAVTQAVSQGDLRRQVDVQSRDEVGQVGTALNSMTAQLRELIGDMEQRVAERTRDLERRSAYLEASTEVGRVAASILDVDLLVQQVVDLIQERFALYYVGLFQVDETGEWAVLRASTGETGRAMLAHEVRVQIDDESMVGWCIANKQARVLREVEGDPMRLDIPGLPDIRSGVVFPMRVHGEAIGALIVGDDQPDTFGPGLVDALQAMVDQIAMALENARLFRQAQKSLDAERWAYGMTSHEAWAQIVRARSNRGYLCTPQGVRAIESRGQPELLEVSESDPIVQDDELAVAIPITVRNHVAGIVRLRKSNGAGRWTGDEIALMKTLTEQLGVALEGAQLYQDTQRRAAREQLTREITDEMRRKVDVESVLRAAVTSLGQALGAPRTYVRLMVDDESGQGDERNES